MKPGRTEYWEAVYRQGASAEVPRHCKDIRRATTKLSVALVAAGKPSLTMKVCKEQPDWPVLQPEREFVVVRTERAG
jgi:hypothetical protein